MDRLAITSPAKSACTHVRSSFGELRSENLNTALGNDFKYLAILRSSPMSNSLGSITACAQQLVFDWMSARSSSRYDERIVPELKNLTMPSDHLHRSARTSQHGSVSLPSCSPSHKFHRALGFQQLVQVIDGSEHNNFVSTHQQPGTQCFTEEHQWVDSIILMTNETDNAR